MSIQAISPRAQFQKLRQLLLMGLLSMSVVTIVLSQTGAVPLVPDSMLIGNVLALVAASSAATGWLWARPKIPIRRQMISIEDYWRDPATMGGANLALFLLEGSATLAIVATMLSGEVAPAAVAAAPILGMVMLSPESIEQRTL